MREELSVDFIKDIAAHLGIDMYEAEAPAVTAKLHVHAKEILFAFNKITEDAKIPAIFKKEDIAPYAVFIKEKFEKEVEILREQRRIEREEQLKNQRIFQEMLVELREKVNSIDAYFWETIEAGRAAGKRPDATEKLWTDFKESVGA